MNISLNQRFRYYNNFFLLLLTLSVIALILLVVFRITINSCFFTVDAGIIIAILSTIIAAIKLNWLIKIPNDEAYYNHVNKWKWLRSVNVVLLVLSYVCLGKFAMCVGTCKTCSLSTQNAVQPIQQISNITYLMADTTDRKNDTILVKNHIINACNHSANKINVTCSCNKSQTNDNQIINRLDTVNQYLSEMSQTIINDGKVATSQRDSIINALKSDNVEKQGNDPSLEISGFDRVKVKDKHKIKAK